jgi:hypothetical protein
MPEIAMHRGFGDPERLAGFEAGEAAEVAQHRMDGSPDFITKRRPGSEFGCGRSATPMYKRERATTFPRMRIVQS